MCWNRLALSRAAQRADHPVSAIAFQAMPNVIKEEAARDASALLHSIWGFGIPVDPVAIARKAGLEVRDAKLDRQTLGALVKRPGQEPTILLNEEDNDNRRRFTCAHEIGHFVRRSDETDEYMTVDLRGPLSAEGMDEDEIFANEFAACLLMPEPEMRVFYELGMSDLEMAIRFKVSREAMQYRLKNLDLR